MGGAGVSEILLIIVFAYLSVHVSINVQYPCLRVGMLMGNPCVASHQHTFRCLLAFEGQASLPLRRVIMTAVMVAVLSTVAVFFVWIPINATVSAIMPAEFPTRNLCLGVLVLYLHRFFRLLSNNSNFISRDFYYTFNWLWRIKRNNAGHSRVDMI